MKTAVYSHFGHANYSALETKNGFLILHLVLSSNGFMAMTFCCWYICGRW